MKITDPCPECGSQLEFDEVDVGVGVLRGNERCDECHWYPGVVKVACECGCGKVSFDKALEFNHPLDYQAGERGCS